MIIKKKERKKKKKKRNEIFKKKKIYFFYFLFASSIRLIFYLPFGKDCNTPAIVKKHLKQTRFENY